jgi:hypothetical protein
VARSCHGGEQRAVFVYQIESYRYWQEQLTRTDSVYGQFGENFTIEELPDDAVCTDPCKERLHMPGSLTTPGRPGALSRRPDAALLGN